MAPCEPLREQLTRVGLAAHADVIVARAHRQLRVTATPAPDPALGASRFGGDPDLPRHATWPRHRWLHAEVARWPRHAQDELDVALARGVVIDEGVTYAKALGFVAQLDLEELADYQTVLPRFGHLWLFADQRTHAGERGDYPHVACAALFAFDRELVRTPAPPVPERLAPAALTFTPELVLPDPGDLALPAEVTRTCEHLARALEPSPRHAVLPAPDHGTTWVPPLQDVGVLRVDTDPAIAACWGDAAWITFAVPAASLAEGRIDHALAFRFIG